MATTREYTDYLNDQVDIAPADSQEELQAAELIESLFVQHGLETQVQEFDAPIFSRLSSHIYLIVLFLGMVLAGILDTVVCYVGIGMVAVSFVLILLARTGRDILASIGPRARSQNVIGVHRATGPNVVKGNRPIVIIAHYDTPRENFLNNRQFAKWQPLLKRLAWPLTIAVLVLAVMQVIPVIPPAARHVFWVLGVLAALPLLLLGASSIYERFAACTTGANDNKASVAAMLGVLDMVRPGPDDAKEWAQSHPKGVRRSLEDELDEQLDELYGDEEYDEDLAEGDEPIDDSYAEGYEESYEEGEDVQEEPAPRRTAARVAAPVVEEDEYGLRNPSTVRRGAAVLESLQVLPETCEIVYENLSPRDEVIERIQIENGGPSKGEGRFDHIREAAGGVGEKIGGGLFAARDQAESLFERIRAFFANLFHRGDAVEVEDEGQVEELEFDDSEYVSDEYEGDEFVDEYDEDEEYDDEYDEEYDDEYDDEEDYDEDEEYEDELGASPQDGVSAPVVEPVEIPAPVVEPAYEPVPAPAVVQEYAPASVTQPFARVSVPEVEPATPAVPEPAVPEPEPVVQTFAAEVSEASVAPVAEAPVSADLGLTSDLPKIEIPSFTEVSAPTVEEPVVSEESAAVIDDYAAARADLEAAREEAAAALWTPDVTVEDNTEVTLDEADVAPIEEAAEDYDDEALQQTDMFEVPDASYIYDADPLDVEPSFAEDVPVVEDEYVEDEYVEEEYVEEPVKRGGFWSFFSRFRPAAAAVEEDVPEADFELVPEAEFEVIEEDDGYSFDETDETYTAGVPVELVDVPAIEDAYEAASVLEPVETEYAHETIEELATDEDDDFAPVVDFEPVTIVDEVEPVVVPEVEPVAVPEPVVVPEIESVAMPEVESTFADAAEFVEPEAVVLEPAELEELVADEPAVVEFEAEELTEAPVAEEQSPVEEFEAPVIEPAVEDEPLVVEVDETEELEASAIEQAAEAAAEAVEETAVVDEPAQDDVPEVKVAAEEEPEPEAEPEPAAEPEPEPATETETEPESYDPFLDLDEPTNYGDEPQVTLWTPSDDYEDDGYDSSEAETTLSFRPIRQEDIDAAKAQKEAAETEASSVLHQMFATAPEQERYEAPRQADVLHEMFATKPNIEPMHVQAQEPEAIVAEETAAEDEVIDQVMVEESEPVEEAVEQNEWLEAEELEATEPIAEEPIADEAEEEDVFSLEEEPVDEPQAAEPAVESGIDARFQSEFIEVIEELEEPDDVIAAEVEVQEVQESEPEVIVADTFDEDVEPEPMVVEEEPEAVEPAFVPVEEEPTFAEAEPEAAEVEPEPVEAEPEATEFEPESVELEPEFAEPVAEFVEQEVEPDFVPEPVFDEELDEVPLAEFESIEEVEAEFEPEFVPEVIDADTFDDEVVPEAEPAPEPEVAPEPEPKPVVITEPEPEPMPESTPEPEPTPEADELPVAEFEQIDEPEPEPEASQEPAAPAVDPDTLRIIESLKFSTEADVNEDDLADKDVTGLTTFPVETEADAEDSLPVVEEQMPKPRAVDDPDWGKTNFKPSVVSMGRRAMLLDLPDPSVMAVDQFGSYDDSEDESTPVPDNAAVSSRFAVLSKVPSPMDEPSTYHEAPKQESRAPEAKTEEAQAPASDEQPMRRYNQQQNIGSRAPKKNSKRKMRFGLKRKDNADQQVESMSDWLGLGDDYDAKKDGRQIGSWDNFDDSDDRGKWKGGATLRAGLRDDEQEEQDDYLGLPNFDSLDLQPKDDQPEEPQEQEELQEETQDELAPEELEELREAVLRLGDDDLIAHDIWFVGLGASSLDHAGIKAFLDEHRRDIRGAFLVNLDSVGAGNLTLLTSEGMGEKRRGDRRMARMLSNIADALHIDLGRADYSWEETDATPAMQRSVRVATLMGMSPDGVAAHSHTSDDEPEYLNDHQIAGVADIIAELIRQS